MNTELMEKVLQHVEARPEKLDMNTWISGVLPEGTAPGDTMCGATCCIAGWALMLSPENTVVTSDMGYVKGIRFPNGEYVDRDGPTYDWGKMGAKALGLDEDQASDIFYRSCTLPDDCDGSWHEEDTGESGDCTDADHAHYDSIFEFTDEVREKLGMLIPVRA